jgi:hypothetical protein
LWTRTKLYQRAQSATMYSWFCSFLENALGQSREPAHAHPHR